MDHLLKFTGFTKCSACGGRLSCSCAQDPNLINGLHIFTQLLNTETVNSLEKALKDIHGPLLAHLSETTNHFKPLLLRIMILGIDDSSKKPWIVVFCPEAAVESTRVFFKGDFAQRCCALAAKQGGLEATVVGRPARMQSGQHVGISLMDSESAGMSPWSGRIALQHRTNTSLHATMGGVLVLEDKRGLLTISGLTVNHLLQQNAEVPAPASAYDMDQLVSDMSNISIAEEPFGRFSEESFRTQAYDRDWALIEFFEGRKVAGLAEQASRSPRKERYALGSCQGSVTLRPSPRPSSTSPSTAIISQLPAMMVMPHGERFVTVHPVTLRDSHSTFRM